VFSFNGCSMKTEEQLEICKAIRPERIMLETGQSLLTYLELSSKLDMFR
jgi:Tat protein secretion system quality control protein TatD with DNase activity